MPGLSTVHAREAKEMAEKVYPILYVFENSARDIIERVLEREFGEDWWNQVSWSEARSELERRKEKEGDDWHSNRGEGPLAYLDLAHLVQLVKKPKVWPFFAGVVPTADMVRRCRRRPHRLAPSGSPHEPAQ